MSNGQTLERQFITKFSQDLLAFLRHRPGVHLESLTHSTPEMSFDLGKARKNQVIHNRAGDRIFVTSLTGVAYIRFNSATGSKYKLRVGSISTPFQKLYLENEAQVGKSLSIIIGYGAFIDFASAYLTTKLLKPDDSEVSPASEEKQDSMLTQLNIKTSQLRDAIIGVVAPKTLVDVVNAFEKLAQKTEIQATSFNQQTAVNVGITSTLILGENVNRKGFYIRHNGDDIIYLGNSTVATGNGLPFFPGNIFTEEYLPVTAAIYGVVASDTEQVRVVEET